MPFEVGATVGNYQIVEKLGQGGMAEVFKAYHAQLDRYVAIKVIHPMVMDDSSFLTRFQREAKMVARLEHPNIVPVYDYAEAFGRPYLVMKYIEGKSLKEVLDDGPLAVAETLRIVEALAAGLSYAHKREVLHRDIKPSNVIIASDGQIYLADFGLARLATSGESSLTGDRIVGTPYYMSPEQALGNPGLDGRADIYSLGVMVFEMLTGKVPFRAETPFTIIHDHIYTAPPSPKEINPDLSDSVVGVILRSLAKDPGERFQSAEDFGRALRSAFQGESFYPQTSGLTPQIIGVEPRTLQPTVVAERMPETVIVPKTSSTAKNPLQKKIPRRYVILLVGLTVLLLAVFGLFGLRGLRNFVQNRHTAQTEAAQVVLPPSKTILPVEKITPTVARDVGLAEDALKIALDAWNQKDYQKANAQLEIVRANAGGDMEFYRRALKNLGAEGEWLLASLLISSPDRKELPALDDNMLQLVHQVFYMTALDPEAGSFFEQRKQNPMLQVSRLRYALYHGDDKTAVKDELGKVLSNPVQVKRFPEARLLEAEMFNQLNDPDRGGEILIKLLGDKSIPTWVRIEAEQLKEKLTP